MAENFIQTGANQTIPTPATVRSSEPIGRRISPHSDFNIVKKPSRVRQIDISRTLKAAISAGLTVAKIEVALDGTISVKVGDEQAESTITFNKWKATQCKSN